MKYYMLVCALCVSIPLSASNKKAKQAPNILTSVSFDGITVSAPKPPYKPKDTVVKIFASATI